MRFVTPQKAGVLGSSFFDQPSTDLAQALVGKLLRRKLDDTWVAVRIVETEAYELVELGSHASLGRTPSREALFMPAGTIYMYHSRAGASLNISARGDGNAVLIKGGVPWVDAQTHPDARAALAREHPLPNDSMRPHHRQCAGQTLLAKSLRLEIASWTERCFEPEAFFVDDDGYRPDLLIQTQRLGIPLGRDEHLFYRWVDFDHRVSATLDPLRGSAEQGIDYFVQPMGEPPSAHR